MNVSDKIKEIREKKRLSQAEVARRFGTSPEFYHRLERKGTKLTIEQLKKIANALEVPIGELLGIEQRSDTERINELEKENQELRRELERSNELLTAYKPVIAMVNFMMKNADKMPGLAKALSLLGVNEETLTNLLPDIKEVALGEIEKAKK
jgi:transcriptional regulator with XRE-family HTH domain